jgi:hypothetical protein
MQEVGGQEAGHSLHGIGMGRRILAGDRHHAVACRIGRELALLGVRPIEIVIDPW